MSFTNCNLHFMVQSDRKVYMTPALLKQLRLSNKATVTLRHGQKAIRASVSAIRKKGNQVYLTSTLRSSLKVPRSGNCYIQRSEDGSVRIGPLMGIMTASVISTAALPFGRRTGLIRRFLRSGSNKAFYFAFAPKDINWQQETINGCFISPNGGWQRRTVPLPDVVYNRLPSRRAELSTSMENFKDRFTRRKIPMFNWSFFNKSDVYSLLEGEPEEKYVPESYINPPAEKIKEMLEKHHFVYLKPTGGSLGKGIYRLTHHPKKGYFSRFRRNGKNVLLRFTKFSSLMNLLNRQGRMKNYVVQQGIRLVELDYCPIDFRVHMNKNSSNKWIASGVGAKKAGKGSVTTHIKNGGKLMTPEQALSRIFGAKSDEILLRIKQVSVKLAEAIERNYPHIIGELGFDIGVDRDEKIWMFEANAKPGRSIFKHPALRSQGNESLAYIFEHCMYLSRFRRGDGT